MDMVLDLDEAAAPAPAPTAKAEEAAPAENKEGDPVASIGLANAPQGEVCDTDNEDEDGEAPPAGGVKKSVKIVYDPTGEPFVAGQCTITLALTLQPDDGHADGRLVVIGAKSHAEAPLFAAGRLNTLGLPLTLTDLLAQYEASLPARGAKVAEAKTKAEAKKKADAEKKAQAEAERKSKAAKTKADHAKKAAPKPEKVEKPKTPEQLAAEAKAKAKADLLAASKAEAAAALPLL